MTVSSLVLCIKYWRPGWSSQFPDDSAAAAGKWRTARKTGRDQGGQVHLHRHRGPH